MASEIRVNKINSRTGVGTITLSPTGVDFTGIATVATLKATTGIVTTLSVTGNATVGGTLDITGATTLNGNLDLQDNDKILVGTGDDLEIYHDGTDTWVDNTQGDLYLRTSGSGDDIIIRSADDVLIQSQASEASVICRGDGQVEIYHNNNKKLETTGVGASVTGAFNVGTGTSITSSSLIVNDVQYPTAGPLSNRNLIDNGDQRIDQRNDGGAVTTSSSFPVDRFSISHSSNGAFSAQRSTEAPTGFQYSTKFTTTTADTSITGSQRLLYFTKVEGLNAQYLEFGTSDAKSVTLSFWVRSSVTGTFSGSIQNGAQNRSYPYDYTINAADTWEHKTVTISGDTTGTWATDNTKSHQIFWNLGVSSDYTATANAWVGAQRWGSTSGTANTLGTLNATWYITGVQYEVGSKATPFEHRSYGDEFARCQRYYQELDLGTNNNVLHMVFGRFGASTGNGFAYFPFPVPMRAAPTFSFLGETFDSSGYTGDPTLGGSTINGAQLNSTNTLGTNANAFLRPNNGSGDFLRLTFTSEL